MFDNHLTDGAKVMTYLRPNGGWSIVDSDFNSITYNDCEVVTFDEFNTTLAQLPQIISEYENEKNEARQSLLNRLGITEEEAKLLLS